MERIEGKVLGILQSREKGKARVSLDQGEFIAGKGLVGDRLFGLKPEIPVLEVEERRRLEATKEQGLCFKRFTETLTVGFTGSLPEAGDVLRIGEALFEVSSQRKRCFPECILVKEKKSCPLRAGVIYLKVKASGSVKVGSEIIKLKE